MTGMKKIPIGKLVPIEKYVPQEIKQWNSKSFSLLYKHYWDSLLEYAASFVNDRHAREEIVQDLFVHLYTKSSSLRINTSLSSYLFVALRNTILNYLRSQAVYKKHVTIAGKENLFSNNCNNNVEQSINLMELEKEISFSLDHMAAKYKEVYVLHEQNDCTIKRISMILNRPIDTVQKQLRKAVFLVRDHLREKKMIQDRN
jgi:RNA polymerase sigma-70 factor (ECF subfamily)